MQIEICVLNKNIQKIIEKHSAQDGTWVNTKTVGLQYAPPVLKKTAIYETIIDNERHLVTVEPLPKVP